MQYTENYQFRKPVIGIDIADVKDVNFNSDKLDALLHNTQISLAPAYDLLETYNTGDIVMYETLMYKCKADNVTGAWDASKWERTTAGEEGSGGGGGSSVVPNPQGEPTDTLETIEIDGTVYDIAGSGGGGGSARKLYKKLYNGNITSTGDLTLLDSIENYDFIMIEIAYLEGEGNPVCGSTIADVTYLKSTYNNNTSIWIDGGNNDRSAKVAFSDATTMKVQKASTYDAIIGVYGLDLNGGAGDASEIIPITAGDGTTSRTFTFDKTPKAVQFYWDDPVLEGTGWIGNGSFVWGQEYITFPAHTRASSVTGMMGGCAVLSYGADGKSVTINGANAFQSLNTPNGSGFIFVDYGGGSGGSAVKDILYSDANGAPHLTDVALAHNIFDYDEVYFKVSNPTDIQTFNAYTQQVFMPMLYNSGERWGIQALYDQRVVEITFASDGLSFQIVRTAGDYSNNTVYEVIGIKH